jgi:hypothetical protein
MPAKSAFSVTLGVVRVSMVTADCNQTATREMPHRKIKTRAVRGKTPKRLIQESSSAQIASGAQQFLLTQ